MRGFLSADDHIASKTGTIQPFDIAALRDKVAIAAVEAARNAMNDAGSKAIQEGKPPTDVSREMETAIANAIAKVYVNHHFSGKKGKARNFTEMERCVDVAGTIAGYYSRTGIQINVDHVETQTRDAVSTLLAGRKETKQLIRSDGDNASTGLIPPAFSESPQLTVDASTLTQIKTHNASTGSQASGKNER
jgi:hypothetical protein